MGAGVVVRFLAEWLIAALVIFALVFELLLHRLEHWIKNKHPQLQSILRNLYRELMILGIVSFGFILFVFTGDRSEDTKMTFEVAHVFMFLFAVFHTIVVCVTVGVSMSLTKRWITLEQMHLVQYLEHKEQYQKLSEKRKEYNTFLWRTFGWWLPNLKQYFMYRKLHEIMTFHDIRWQFIHFRGLKNDFKFSKFLRKVKVAIFIELAEIKPANWILLLGIIVVDQVRRYIGLNHRNFEPAYLIADSFFNMFVVTLLSRKIRRIYWKLTKNPATYYDSVDVNKFRTELANVEEEARKRRNSSDISRVSNSEQNQGSSGQVSFGLAKYMFRDAPKKRNAQEELLETAKKIVERNDTEQPVLIGMATAMPTRELRRNSYDRVTTSKEADNNSITATPTPVQTPNANESTETLDRPRRQQTFKLGRTQFTMNGSGRKQISMTALKKLREKKKAEEQQAEGIDTTSSVSYKYPAWVVKLFPRLGRIPSQAEKLFWFGSHRFYIFLVEFVLFFTNVNLSATIAKLIFRIKDQAAIAKALKESGKVGVVVRAPASTATVVKNTEPLESLTLLLVALGMGILALLYVLLRIANIMKKYIFVLNNADLLPDHLMDETIQTVNLNDMIAATTTRDENGEPLARYDSDTDDELEQDHSALRRNMTSYIATQSGTVRDI